MAGHRKSVKKAMEDYIDRGESEFDLQDRGIENLLEVPYLSKLRFIFLVAFEISQREVNGQLLQQI